MLRMARPGGSGPRSGGALAAGIGGEIALDGQTARSSVLQPGTRGSAGLPPRRRSRWLHEPIRKRRPQRQPVGHIASGRSARRPRGTIRAADMRPSGAARRPTTFRVHRRRRLLRRRPAALLAIVVRLRRRAPAAGSGSLRLPRTAGAADRPGSTSSPASEAAGDRGSCASPASARSWRAAGRAEVHLELGRLSEPGRRPAWWRPRPRWASATRNSTSWPGRLRSLTAGRPRPAPDANRGGHADEWDRFTHHDPERDLEAMMTGSLVDSDARRHVHRRRRAAPLGRPLRAARSRTGVRLARATSCARATPFLPRPAATIGLGDTFLAGFPMSLSTP